MKPYLLLIFIMLLPLPLLMSCNDQPVKALMEDYLWQKRPLLLFAPSSDDAQLLGAREILQEHMKGIKERDMVIWYVIHHDKVVIDDAIRPHLPAKRFYEHYNVAADTFTMLLIGKDGEVKLQQEAIIPIEELFATIDAMPMRQQEIQQQRTE